MSLCSDIPLEYSYIILLSGCTSEFLCPDTKKTALFPESQDKEALKGMLDKLVIVLSSDGVTSTHASEVVHVQKSSFVISILQYIHWFIMLYVLVKNQ